VKLVAFFGPALVAGVVSYVLTPPAREFAVRVGAVDRPDARKVHAGAVPRLGGLAVLFAVVLVLGASCLGLSPFRGAALPHGLCLGIGLGLLPIVAVSIRDDNRPLRAAPKILAHALGALAAVLSGITLAPEVHLFGQSITLGVLAVPISLVWIVGVTNAFNIVDGLDGLSAGLALISAASLAGVFFLSGQLGIAGAALVLAGALVGFLPYNMFPARVFLGDTGATAIGFCLACFALRGGATLSAGFATLIPVLALGLPVAETLTSVARRVVRRIEQKGSGTGVFEADRNHIHHRLLALGLDHRRVVLILYGVGIVLAGSAFLSVLVSARKAGLLLISIFVAVLIGIARLGYDEFAVIRKGVALRFYEAPVLKRSLFVVFVDLFMAVAALALAFCLKNGDWITAAQRPLAMTLFAIVAPCTVVVFWALGMYKGAWRLASLDDFLRATWAVLASSAAALAVALVFGVAGPVISVYGIYALLMLAFVNGSRGSYRALQHRKWRASSEGEAALIYGAGLGGMSALRELLSNPLPALRPVGFLEDAPEKAGRVFNGYPVVGSLEDLDDLLSATPIRAVVVATAKIPEGRVNEASAICERHGVALYRFHISFDHVGAQPRGLKLIKGS
jgi:UDP-GlcNAc:undecaprenyl-phosphate GlcNAc-1-phosphate transferase